MANEGINTIVLVSSEGSVVPIVQQLSGVSRCNKFFEVIDVKEEAVEILMKQGFPKELSKRFVQYTGIYLVNGYNKYTAMNPCIEDELYEKMIEDLFTWKLMKQHVVLKVNEPYTITIIRLLHDKDELDIANIIEGGQCDNNEKLIDMVTQLVDANLSRYI